MAVRASHGCSVLVVDDEPDVRETLADILTWKGYEVREASNGQEAMDSVHASKPCLILLDLMMPVMDGWEFCRLKSEDKSITEVPVVIISGVTGLQPNIAALSAAAIASKPVDLPALLTIIAEYCRKRATTAPECSGQPRH